MTKVSGQVDEDVCSEAIRVVVDEVSGDYSARYAAAGARV